MQKYGLPIFVQCANLQNRKTQFPALLLLFQFACMNTIEMELLRYDNYNTFAFWPFSSTLWYYQSAVHIKPSDLRAWSETFTGEDVDFWFRLCPLT